jgi:hypothetical protein
MFYSRDVLVCFSSRSICLPKRKNALLLWAEHWMQFWSKSMRRVCIVDVSIHWLWHVAFLICFSFLSFWIVGGIQWATSFKFASSGSQIQRLSASQEENGKHPAPRLSLSLSHNFCNFYSSFFASCDVEFWGLSYYYWLQLGSSNLGERLWLLLKSDVQCFTTSFTWHEFSLELFLVSIFEEQSINHALLFIFLIEIEKESYLVKILHSMVCLPKKSVLCDFVPTCQK